MERDPNLPLNIMWVEDSLDTILLQDILEDAGVGLFELFHCLSLKEAITLAKAQELDVILLDLTLPDARGLETVTRMCQETGEVPIVVMTGQQNESLAVQSVRAGAQDYLVKTQMDSQLLAKTLLYAMERKRSEEALRQANEQLKNANEELKSLDRIKDEFIALVSHEFRTPLCSILGYADAIADYDLKQADHDRFVNVIIEESERLMRLIENVLNLSKIAAGSQDFNFCSLALDTLIEQVFDSLAVLADDKGLRFDYTPSNLHFMGDEDCMKQVLINIMANAIKFSPKDGTIFISYQSTETQLTLSVRDEGPGIPKDYAGKIFERFQQAKPEQAKGQGSGLGLAIVKNFIEAHQGKVWTEPSDHGAIVSFTLPLQQ